MISVCESGGPAAFIKKKLNICLLLDYKQYKEHIWLIFALYLFYYFYILLGECEQIKICPHKTECKMDGNVTTDRCYILQQVQCCTRPKNKTFSKTHNGVYNVW